jgi:hypothetical protein
MGGNRAGCTIIHGRQSDHLVKNQGLIRLKFMLKAAYQRGERRSLLQQISMHASDRNAVCISARFSYRTRRRRK